MNLLIKNAKLWSPHLGYVQADSLYIHNGIIEKIGYFDRFSNVSSSHTLDIGGKLVIPAFNDAHLHLMDGGFALQKVDLRDARNEEEFCKRLKQKAKRLPKGEWITGGYWDHERWPGKHYPTRNLIDQVVSEHPVFVVRLDLHVGTANSLALQLAGIDEDAVDPAGGHFGRDPENKRLNGVVQDAAQKKILDAIPVPDRAQCIDAVLQAISFAHSNGITSVQGECTPDELEIYEHLCNAGRFDLRFSGWQRYRNPKINPPTRGFLKLQTQKVYADGSLGAGTALLTHPYRDNPASSGLAMHTPEALSDIFCTIHSNGDQIAVHAIGDLAVQQCLNAFETLNSDRPLNRYRHRIEHLQVVQFRDIERFANMGIIASVQPYHCIDDMRWIENRLADSTVNAYRLRSLLDGNVHVALGTDWPVEPLNPLHTLYAAASREYIQGGPNGGWYAGEKVSLQKAVECYTFGSAYAEKAEQTKGLIKPGYLADLVVLSRDIFQQPVRALLNTRVDMTLINGKVVYARKKE